MTCMPKAAQRLATSRPMRPKPRIRTRRAEEVDGAEVVADGPAALAGRAVVAGALLGEGEHEVERVLGDRGGIRVGGDRERDAAAGERSDVDVVVADAVARDDLEVQCLVEDVAGQGRGADRDAVGVPDLCGDFGLVGTVDQLGRNVRAGREQLHAVLVEAADDQA